MGEEMIKKFKLELVLEIETTNPARTKEQLESIPGFLADRGLFTGESSDEVVRWGSRVTLVKGGK